MKEDIEDRAEAVSQAHPSEEKLIASKDVDAALQFLHQNAAAVQRAEINDKQLMRRVDWLIMPLMFACYYLQYTDKTLLSYAAVMGIIEDTHMPSNGFSHLAIAFYISFLVCEPLQSVFLQKFPTAKYLGANVILWGIVVTMNCACHNYSSVVALRVLLGVFEASVAPSLVVLTSMWYKRHEQVVRLAAGILVILFLPDNLMKSRFTAEEKIHILERIRENQTGVENKKVKWKQVKEVFLDVRTWMLSLIVIATNVPNGAVSSFSSIIIQNFGYDDYQTLLLNIPGSAVAFVTCLFGSWWAGRFNARGVAIIFLIIPTLLGGALMAWLPPDNKAGLLAGSFLTNSVGSSMPMLFSWVISNYAGHTKKVTMNAIVLMSFCLGNIIGPETFQDKDAPQYIPAKVTIVAVLSVAIMLTLCLDLLYSWENKKRDADGVHDLPPNFEFLDLTDKENKNFRYML